jgi:carboxypeptidase Taq
MAGKQRYLQLVEHLRHQGDLAAALHLLQWDQETYMPAGVAETRARQIGALAAVLHERRTEPGFLDLVDELAARADLDPEQAVDVRETKWRVDRQRALDAGLVRERSQLHAEARSHWVEARAQDDFAALRPYLRRIVEVERRVAGCIDAARDPYEVLLEGYEPGMTVGAIEAAFTELRTHLQPLVAGLPAAGDGCGAKSALEGSFPIDRQREFNHGVAAAIGFDFSRGRLDVAAHPFTMTIGDDVRLTTRFDAGDLRYSLYSTIHEAGHGLYEQGLDPAARGLPRGQACSLGVHESQSRFWENIVGRSRAFWQYLLPRARATFPGMREVALDAVVRSANQARRSLIRTEADEITYNLHIILRFELERALVAGTLPVAELPQAWRDGMQKYFAVAPANDRDGVLQDVHWAGGAIGYFPTYTLGNIYAAELAAAVDRDLGPLEELLARGDFAAVLGWLRTNVHRLGQTHRGRKLIEVAVGHTPDARALTAHLIRKSRVIGSG